MLSGDEGAVIQEAFERRIEAEETEGHPGMPGDQADQASGVR
jgi:hypothetical protein